MPDLFFDKNVIRYLKRLDKNTRARIMGKLTKAKDSPKRYFVRLKGVNLWKMRIGDYRVVAAIEKTKIRILKIGPRKNIYRKI